MTEHQKTCAENQQNLNTFPKKSKNHQTISEESRNRAYHLFYSQFYGYPKDNWFFCQFIIKLTCHINNFFLICFLCTFTEVRRANTSSTSHQRRNQGRLTHAKVVIDSQKSIFFFIIVISHVLFVNSINFSFELRLISDN